MNSRPAASRWFLILLGILVAVGCDDDVTGPRNDTATLAELWPAGEEATWMYHWSRSMRVPASPTLYATPEEVPPVPDFDAAYALLTAESASEFDPALEQFYELALEGPDTTASGVAGRRLRATTFGRSEHSSRIELDGDRVLREHIGLLRSDPQTRSVVGGGAAGRVELYPWPVFLRGGLLDSGADQRALFGDLEEDPNWLYLIADLSLGSEFSLLVAPSIRSDVGLHGQVRRTLEVETGGRVLRGCIEVLYVLDAGLAALPDGEGEGYYRKFSVGTVIYAPSVGPVASEELIGLTSTVDDPQGQGRSRLELRPGDLVRPPRPTPAPDLGNIWPNRDGDYWTYRCDTVVGVGEQTQGYETPEAVPPLPDLDEMLAWLEAPLEVTEPGDLDAWMRLQFDGTMTTDSGAQGQNLSETFWYPTTSGPSPLRSRDPDRLLERILRLRPELRDRAARLWPERVSAVLDRISAGSADGRMVDEPDALPFILFGYAWEKTSEHIGTYGDIDRLLAWKFLEADLRPGHEFSHQLVPALADDVWLHARVIGTSTVTAGGRTYEGCIEVLYVLDQGVVSFYGPDEQRRYFRSLHAGTITYAPGVGPVACRERVDFGGMPVTQDLGTQWTVADREVKLVEVQVGP